MVGSKRMVNIATYVSNQIEGLSDNFDSLEVILQNAGGLRG